MSTVTQLKPTARQKPDEIWYTRCPVPTTSGLAQHFRWLHAEFERQGIRVESIRASADSSVRVSHFDHTHPNMFREGGNIPPIWAKANGRDTAVVGITWIDEEQVILVRPDSDIRTLSDLRGKRLGLPRRNDSQIVDVGRGQDLRGLLTAVKLANLTRDDVVFEDLVSEGGYDLREQNQRESYRHQGAEALIAGKVDAIYAKGAVSATLIEEHGFRPIVDINAQTDPLLRVNAGTPRPITVNRDLAVNHPEIVARYLAVLLRTAKWAEGHPEDVVKGIAAETGSTEEAVRRGYGNELHLHFKPELSEQYVKGLELQKDFLLEEGFIKGDFDFQSWILREPLELARQLVDEVSLPLASD